MIRGGVIDSTLTGDWTPVYCHLKKVIFAEGRHWLVHKEWILERDVWIEDDGVYYTYMEHKFISEFKESK